jgi:hypothetical protein
VNVHRWTGAFQGEGVYIGTPMADYRADPCPTPSLNNSVARLVIGKSLAHAKAAHPRLAEAWSDDEEDEAEEKRITRAMDIGSAAHRLAFGVGDDICIVHAENWRKKDAQEAAKVARVANEIPLLPKEYRRAKAMAAISGPIITDLLGGSVAAEVMIACQEDGKFWRRGLIDRCSADLRVIIDFKTTATDLTPASAKAHVYTAEHFFQEAFYRRILDRLDPAGMGRRRFCFLYQEQKPPFGCVLVEIDEAGRTCGEQDVDRACRLWDAALTTGEWPGFPLGPHIATPTSWVLERRARQAEVEAELNAMEML